MAFEFITLPIDGLILIKPKVYEDNRGFFFEAYNSKEFFNNGIVENFVQDNQSFSYKNVIRGLHFQHPPYAQGKLVRCISGEIWDVAVDIRPHSSTFKRWAAVTLSGENKNMLFIPAGFAHGFCTLSDKAELLYKCTNLYDKNSDGGILWNDSDININWPITNPIISEKDAKLPLLDTIYNTLPGHIITKRKSYVN